MMREKRLSRGTSFSLWLPILMIGFLLILALLLLERWPKLAYGTCAAGAVYLVLSIVYYEYLTRLVNNELYEAGFQQSQLYKSMLKELPVPYVLTTAAGAIVWYNDLFEQMCEGRVNKRNIDQIFPILHKKNFAQPELEKVLELKHRDKDYKVQCQCVKAIETDADVEELEEKTVDEYLQVFYFYDVTELTEYKGMAEKKRLVTGLMYIDNYEEVLENMEDVRQSLLLALVERKVVRYMQTMDAIVKRFEKDKFIFLFQEKNLDQMLEDKFSILDEVRSINAGNEMSLTLSIGVGMNAPTYIGTYESARIAMDMALGRGGDQAVVKNGNSITYYGGKTQKVEKSTRVKARVKAHALREMILTNDTILIMGHKNPDADCIGAAIGVYRMAKTFGKKAYLVIDKNCPAIEPIVSLLEPEDDEKLFLTNEEVLSRKDPRTMLVVVDVNVPGMTECPGLLKTVRNIVVFDHHRQSSETIKNAVLSYVEPYASSTCEMIAEILQYISDKSKLKPVEADAMYSGILVDTDNFVIKAGVRTFEAAAYLRRMGADVTRVRKMFREDKTSYMLRVKVIREAEIFRDEFAISEFHPTDYAGATVVGARAANELLNIQGIRGSFVLTRFPDYIYISARSIDDLNVQVIMEKMGGGGHLTMAAAQVKDMTMEETKQKLKDILTQQLDL